MEMGRHGIPVIANGGISGSDPEPSLAGFEQLVSRPQIHYFVSGGGAGGFACVPGRSGASGPVGADEKGSTPGGFAAGGPGGGSGDASPITSWVEAHFKSQTVGGTTAYNLSSPKAGAGSIVPGTASPGAPARPASPPARVPRPSGSAPPSPPASFRPSG